MHSIRPRHRRILLFLLIGLSIPLILSQVSSLFAAGGGGTMVLSKQGTEISIPQPYLQGDCDDCHGNDASGNGPEHSDLIPQPANLTLVQDSPAYLTSVIKNGIPGTAMHPNNLTDAQIGEILTFVTSVATNMQREWIWPYTYLSQNKTPPPDMGRTLFITSCAGCHGTTGNAQTGILQNPYFWPKPANFQARNAEVGRLYYIITYGRPGTMMPQQLFKYQSDESRWALAQYVHSLFSNAQYAEPTGPMQQYQNPYTTDNQQIVNRGQTVTDLYCGYCHGMSMQGSYLAPNLIDRYWLIGGGTDNNVFQVVTYGVYGTLMPPNSNLPEADRWAAITYIRWHGGRPDPVEALQQQQALAEEEKGGGND